MVTRVTNSMLSRQLLSNLNLNLNNLDKLQNQLASGRKYAHISDDPASLIYGQAARNKLARLSHYQGAIGTAQNWLTQAESGIMELQGMVGKIYEEVVNAGGPKTIADRNNIGMMIYQMKDHYLDTLNAAYGDRFVFSGYNTPGDYVQGNNVTIKPFTIDDNGDLLYNGFNVSQFDSIAAGFILNSTQAEWDDYFANATDSNGDPLFAAYADVDDYLINGLGVAGGTADLEKFHSLKSDLISLIVGPGIEMPVTMNGLDVIFFATQDNEGNAIMRNMFSLLDEVHGTVIGDPKYLNANGEPVSVMDGDEITGLTKLIKLLQDGQNHLLVKTAEIGGRTRRLELLEARYDGDQINYNQMRSDAEDADIAEVIMYMKMAETVYQAALSAGSRVIQPTLMDFLR